MGRQSTRKCHWVPQSYLKAFACDEKREKIWRFEKPKRGIELKKFERKPIEKIPVRNYLYVPRDQDGLTDNSFENRLANEIEPIFSDPVWILLQTEMVDLSWEPLRMMVALAASVLLLRTPLEFEQYSQMHSAMVDMLEDFEGENVTINVGHSDQKIDWDEFSIYRNWSDDDIKRSWISFISGAGAIADDLKSMRWSILRSETRSFITSDNPVTVLHPSTDFRGLNDPLTTVRFPISPTHVLYFDHRHSEPPNQYYSYPEPANLNMLMWRNSLEHAFSHRQPNEVVNEMLDLSEKYNNS